MTLYEVPAKVEKEFADNLSDWFRGGPKAGGWNRTGPELPERQAKLLCYHFEAMPVEEVLAKNREETARWHLSFLKSHTIQEYTPYYQEYLLPRYGDRSMDRAGSFLQLYDDIREEGVLRAVWVADMKHSGMDLGFRYFRFNGCHRTCAAKTVGLKEVPAFVFMAVAR